MVIMVDNSSDDDILWLRRKLESKAYESGLKKRRVLFSILYLVRQFDEHGSAESPAYASRSQLDDSPFYLSQKPNETEIRFLFR
jgi:hypothetical protein